MTELTLIESVDFGAALVIPILLCLPIAFAGHDMPSVHLDGPPILSFGEARPSQVLIVRTDDLAHASRLNVR